MIDPEYGYLEPQLDGLWTYHTDLVFGDGDVEDIPGLTHDQCVTNWINKIADASGTTVVIENLHGPGGGWPTVTFKGDHDHIEALVKKLATESPVWTT